MNIRPGKIPGLWVAEQDIYIDSRGSFSEWFKASDIQIATGIKFDVLQSNISISHKNVVRGIHYSLASEGQMKWVKCAAGKILDVVVDMRIDSPTFRQHETFILDSKSGKSVFLGQGLGHGFMSLEENSIVIYSQSSNYSNSLEMAMDPFDVTVGIDWPGEEFLISDKDKSAPSLQTLISMGKLPRKSPL